MPYTDDVFASYTPLADLESPSSCVAIEQRSDACWVMLLALWDPLGEGNWNR